LHNPCHYNTYCICSPAYCPVSLSNVESTQYVVAGLAKSQFILRFTIYIYVSSLQKQSPTFGIPSFWYWIFKMWSVFHIGIIYWEFRFLLKFNIIYFKSNVRWQVIDNIEKMPMIKQPLKTVFFPFFFYFWGLNK